jgi:hypothetical protein
VATDPEYFGSYRMRLYLWRMEDAKLLIMDELTAPDVAACEEYLPMLLDIMMPAALEAANLAEAYKEGNGNDGINGSNGSTGRGTTPYWDPARWVYTGAAANTQRSNPVDMPDEWIYIGPEPQKWLYLGARGGGGYSQWYNNPDYNPSKSISDYWSANIAAQLSVHIFRFFDIQTEANFALDVGSYGVGSSGKATFSSLSLTVPLLLKLNLQGSHLKTDIYAGPHIYIPLAQENEGDFGKFEPKVPGITVGASVGWKLGPGYLFLDGRFEYDSRWSEKAPVYYRNSFKANVGYEWGLLQKK